MLWHQPTYSGKWHQLTVVLGWSLCVFAGCRSGLGASCQDNQDCRSDQVCARNECARTCSRDDDCSRSGYDCRPYSPPEEDEELQICQSARDAGAGDTPGCTDNRECERRLDTSRARCGINRRCIVSTQSPRYGVLIRDQTPDDRSREQDDGQGVDLAAIVATDAGASPSDAYAYADVFQYRLAEGGDRRVGPLDGSPPRWRDSNRCVQGMFEESTLSMGGEGGLIAARFVDADGDWTALRGGSRLVVLEWGSNCGTDDMPRDTYSVHLCVSYEDNIDPERHCQRRLGRGSGLSTFSLPDDIGS